MLVVMAIDAEILPVAPIGRVVMVITIPMVDSEEVEGVEFELATALCTDPAMDFERALPVVVGSRQLPFHLADKRINLFLTFGLAWLGLAGTE